jgi:hypothetical protein
MTYAGLAYAGLAYAGLAYAGLAYAGLVSYKTKLKPKDTKTKLKPKDTLIGAFISHSYPLGKKRKQQLFKKTIHRVKEFLRAVNKLFYKEDYFSYQITD